MLQLLHIAATNISCSYEIGKTSAPMGPKAKADTCIQYTDTKITQCFVPNLYFTF